MVTIAVVIALYAFVESPFVSASGAIAVLAFGIMMGNSKTHLKAFKKINGKNEEGKIIKQNILSNSAKNVYTEISFFVKVFFFVYLGILFDFSQAFVLFTGLIITIAIYATRIPVVHLAFRKERVDDKSKQLLRYLIPKGLAAAVLAQLALESNIPGADTLVHVVFSVILISIIMTSVLIFLIGKKGKMPSFDFTKDKQDDDIPAVAFNKQLSDDEK